MFLPGNVSTLEKEAEERKAAFKRIEAWSLVIIPEKLREGVAVSISEVQCGDPDCAPIDTTVTIAFDR
jgi:hypothetical protein